MATDHSSTKPKKKAAWVKARHRFFRALIYFPVLLLTRIRCHTKVDKLREHPARQYLILYNHQTDFDQLILGLAFRQSIYYIAMEDLLSRGFVSAVLRFTMNPIPIRKQTTDLKALQDIFQVVKEGGTIAISPEGNRTYSGRTCYINPSIAKLARRIKLPIALFRIEGAYGMQPRWSNVVRKGPVHAFVSRIIEPEEYAKLTNDELYSIIKEGLWDDEAQLDHSYYSKKSAEYLERAAYLCPWCGPSHFLSKGQLIRCTSCGREIRYLPTKELEGVGFAFPHRFFADWYDAQNDYMNALDPAEFETKPFTEDRANLLSVILYQRKELLREDSSVKLYGNRLVIDEGRDDELLLPFESAAVTILGRNRLNIYHGEQVYQIRGDEHFNALKYLNLYNRWKNITNGTPEATFLGI